MSPSLYTNSCFNYVWFAADFESVRDMFYSPWEYMAFLIKPNNTHVQG